MPTRRTFLGGSCAGAAVLISSILQNPPYSWSSSPGNGGRSFLSAGAAGCSPSSLKPAAIRSTAINTLGMPWMMLYTIP
ncbi:twin-arginine translocation signal domain-containing protein [uncultured Gemmiger sp.]|uniref:twin-arginine translocation signal domain-containing protein n=1 Tax=uncultured Gemmiger sp. TaxID=1623490 RepID=UPI0034123507